MKASERYFRQIPSAHWIAIIHMYELYAVLNESSDVKTAFTQVSEEMMGKGTITLRGSGMEIRTSPGKREDKWKGNHNKRVHSSRYYLL